MSSIIYSGYPGSLPFKIQYTPEIDQAVTLILTGSAYSTNGNVKIGISVDVNGSHATSAEIFSNGPSTHRALVSQPSNYTFPFEVIDGVVQPVTITFNNQNSNTIFDINDSITLMVL